MSAAGWLAAIAAVVVGVLGTLHLVFTFHGTRLHPRDEALIERLQQVSPRLTRETTMWRAGLGFHASHSLGAMLFGLVFAERALAPGAPLFAAPVMALAGAAYLLAMLALAKAYWFRIPFRGLLIANLLYLAALALAWR
ncbi:MAG TPA: hypothetical protein VGQ91_12480 [Ideonella sp.]|nr:hypothetical protein [Ideonella sp.]